jgi:hypothetical protein
MSGPPPWTITGFMPTSFSSATSRANDAFSSGVVIAAPPYLITIVAPANSRMYGSASSSTSTRGSRSARERSVLGGVFSAIGA